MDLMEGFKVLAAGVSGLFILSMIGIAVSNSVKNKKFEELLIPPAPDPIQPGLRNNSHLIVYDNNVKAVESATEYFPVNAPVKRTTEVANMNYQRYSSTGQDKVENYSSSSSVATHNNYRSSSITGATRPRLKMQLLNNTNSVQLFR